MNTDMTIKASDLTRNIVMHVRLSGVRVLRVRLWMATKLIVLAAMAAGCGLRVDVEKP